MNKKILFILHLPQPVHGSSLVGKSIKESNIINQSIDGKFINLTTSRTIDEIGKNPIFKIIRYFKILFKVIIYLIMYNPKVVYLAIAAKGVAFYKDFTIALVAKLFGKSLVLHYHPKGVSERQNMFFDNLLYKVLFKNTKVILLSESLYFDVKKYVSLKNIFYCANGISVSEFSKNHVKKVNKIPQLLFLSNLIETKGVYVLLDALKLLKDQGLLFHCNFVGGEADINSEQFNNKLKKLKIIDCVSYLGKKYGKEKYEIFNSSDIFVFPTFYHNETFPLVTLEAMMSSLPIISTSEGAIADIVTNNETGFIVERENPEVLAHKIKFLIENPVISKKMGERGRAKFYEFYTIEVFEKKLLKILNSLN
tara:strand:+ start:13222 stop:14319 length:1098 start_codon:yes stop_codon:yes gene_type:complete